MATLEEEITGTELVLASEVGSLFRADGPAAVLAEARAVAEALKPALVQGGMTLTIGRNEHVLIEGWQTLGGLLKVFAHTTSTRRLEPPLEGWEASAEVRTLDGRVLSSADGMCERGERNWRTSPEFQIRSMAQTRAQSKAYASALRFIVTLAGYSGTPAEEAGGREYGPAASAAGVEGAVRAALMVYDGDVEAAEKLISKLGADAGGYMPKLLARAVQFVAACKPGPISKPAADAMTEAIVAEAELEGEAIVDPDTEAEPEGGT